MTLLEIPSESIRERSIPVLETERLILRAPRLGDAKIVAVLANDRRIAENTARIPHPYRRTDADDFIVSANRGSETTFVVAQRNGQGNPQIIGACGFTQIDRHPPEIGYWLGVKFWGKGYATEAVRAVIDHVFTDLDCEAIQVGRTRHQPGVAPRAGEVRLPVDRRGPLAHPRAVELGADRPLPPRPRPVGLAQKLGQHATGVMMTFTRHGQPVVELKAVRGSVKPITTEALDWLAERRTTRRPARDDLRGTMPAPLSVGCVMKSGSGDRLSRSEKRKLRREIVGRGSHECRHASGAD
jgi:RimJ/RimL family protein N-acetyltransferase